MERPGWRLLEVVEEENVAVRSEAAVSNTGAPPTLFHWPAYYMPVCLLHKLGTRIYVPWLRKLRISTDDSQRTSCYHSPYQKSAELP